MRPILLISLSFLIGCGISNPFDDNIPYKTRFDNGLAFFEEEKYISLILSSGEEYVPVFTSPKNLLYLNNKKLLIDRRIKIICIGIVERGKGVNLNNFNLGKIKKFNHFKNNYFL